MRTVAVTAAKAGAKAVISSDGTITGGWIGGGCARGAVLKAAQDVLSDGQPRLISVQPPTELELHGVAAGETRDGVRFAKNMCPSQGTMDIFVEPVMPRPSLVICGSKSCRPSPWRGLVPSWVMRLRQVLLSESNQRSIRRITASKDL